MFLPIVFVLYWFVFGRMMAGWRFRLRAQNAFVVVASYVFYGWWDWRFLLLIAFTSLCSWGSGLLIGKAVTRKGARTWMWLNVILNLGILATFKYYDFFVAEFARLFRFSSDGLLLRVILPVGISFYTFQALSYSIDVYRGKMEPTRDVVAFFAFISFFPQLVAGPIERATNLLPQFLREREFDYGTAVDGMRQILWGLFKKVVVADNCAVYVNQVFSSCDTQSGSTLLLGAVFFAFQIYGDFSGYSDIAIGTAKLFGIRLMRNFNVPYFSRDIAEFWRRWHVSLTTWFRDYVYIPLGGSRVGKAKVVRNTFVIFLVSGFWHGANWTFIAWGAYHALLFLPLILLGRNRKYTNQVAEGRVLPTFGEMGRMLLTFVLVVIGWVIFRAETIGQAWQYLCGIVDGSLFSLPFMYVGTKKALLMVAVMLLMEWITRKKEHALQYSNKLPSWVPWIGSFAVVLLILEFGGHSQSFIYFQF